MAMEKVEYQFPDEGKNDTKAKNDDIEIEKSSAVEIDLSPKDDKSEVKERKTEKKVETKKDDYEIEVVNDVPKADRGRKPSEPPSDITEEELAEYSDKVKNRIKHFSKGYHDERRAKEQAFREKTELERLAQQLVDENKKLKETQNKNQTAMLEAAKKTAAKDLEDAKNAYKVAYDAGDSEAIVTAQENITAAKIKSDRLDNFKLPTLQEEDSAVQKNKGNAPTPPVDPKAQDWHKSNPWYGVDDEMTSYALGLHSKLVKQKGQSYVNTDEYWETIDSRMRKLFPENFEGAEETEAEEPKKPANVVAPATRSTSPKKVKLTQTQVSLAKRLGVPLEMYAKKVAEEMRKNNG